MYQTARRSGYRKREKRMEAVAEPFSQKKFTLNNGVQMPAVGFGTYRIREDDEVMKVMDCALNAGYRMFDSVACYNSESHLKKALQTLLPIYELEREDIFITAKLAPAVYENREFVESAYRKSISSLGVDYVDMFLVNFPGSSRLQSNDPRILKSREISWKCLEELYDEGIINAIGVSNYSKQQLKHLLKTHHSVIPAVNQVEYHPYFQQTDVFDFCKQNDIVLQAYCSFGGAAENNMELLTDPVVKEISDKHSVTAGQVLLVWSLQKGIAVIPKSTNLERIKQNISLDFRLDDEDMKLMDALGEKNVKYAWELNPSG